MKCKFIKRCKWYDKESVICNKEGGLYYGGVRPAGCYKENQRKEDLKDEK